MMFNLTEHYIIICIREIITKTTRAYQLPPTRVTIKNCNT